MVSPEGRWYSTDGSHPDWAHENRDLVGFVGTQDIDYKPASGARAVFDDDGRIALDYFKDAGWIRVKSGAGIELDLHHGNLGLAKRILREMLRDEPGPLYVDTGDGTKRVSALLTGRPDFSELDAAVRGRHGRYR